MEQTHTATVNTEAKFDFNELFFSITGHDSTILSGNEVFVQISGYSKEELIGSYHNIVRHSDMPRVIFKTLWDHLNAGKPVVAYVKNRTKRGEYYWVLAAVFPRHDRHISIRIKPNTKLFGAVRELYFKLLMLESKEGMERSEKALPEFLKALGYESYDQFMSDALLRELRENQGMIPATASLREEKSEADFPFVPLLKTMQRDIRSLQKGYEGWFEKINTFLQVKEMFEEKSLVLRQVAREIVFLSLNASVSSYKVESGGETFGILARDVRTNAKENDALISQIDTVSHRISDSLDAIIFSVSGIRLQMMMVTRFIEELLCKECDVQSEEIEENMGTLIALVIEYSEESNQLQMRIDQEMRENLKYLDQLEQQMMYLGYVQVYGIIEAAGSKNETVSFEGIFSQLKSLIQKTSQEIEAMQKMGRRFYAENRLIVDASKGNDILLHCLEKTMTKIKEMVK